ncbi:hypothetical protein CYMTET_36998 [Cymbomonas tetramitiformis]|uniref:Uncharacterized protein n=1 Tax=Cymbomonas tetramitiformis TaxID=36881 RepID=A0AAE0CH86_9CHLO|nr:hypothetical protein CYMTET_36998 [Cymbomonas tetramitiformis]
MGSEFKPHKFPEADVERLEKISDAAIRQLKGWVSLSANGGGSHPESRVPVRVKFDNKWYYGLLLGVKPSGEEFFVVFTDGDNACCTKRETYYPKEDVESEEARSFVNAFNKELAFCKGFKTWLDTLDIKAFAPDTPIDLPASPGRSTELSVPKQAGPAVVAGAAAETGAGEATEAKCPAAQAGAAAAGKAAESGAAAADVAISGAAAGDATAIGAAKVAATGAGAGQAAVVAQAGAGKAEAAGEAATGEALSEAVAGGKKAAGAAKVAATKTGAAQVAVEARPGAKVAVTAASGAAAAGKAAAGKAAESGAAAADVAISVAAAGEATAIGAAKVAATSAGAGQAAVVAQAGAGKAEAAGEAATGEALSEAVAGGKKAAGAAEVAATKTGAAQVAVEARPGAKVAVTTASGAAASGAAAAGKAAAGKAAAGKAISVAAATGAAAAGKADAGKAAAEDKAPVGSPSPDTTSKPQTGSKKRQRQHPCEQGLFARKKWSKPGNKAATAGAAAAGASKAGAAEAGAAKATSTKGQSRYRSLNGPAAAGASGNKAASAGAAETEAETPKGKKAKIEYPYVYCGTAYAIDKKTNLPGLFACLSYPESDAGSVYLEPISKMLEIADQPWYIEKEVAAQECQDYDEVQRVHIQEPVLRYLVDQHLEQCSTEEAASFMVKLVQEFGSKNSGGKKALMKLVRQQLAKD